MNPYRPQPRPNARQHFWNWFVTIGSVLLCLLVLPMRLPGMDVLGVGPNWLLIWVVAWSISRTALDGAIAGLTLGLLQDSLTAPAPTHAFGLIIAGVLASRLQQRRFMQEDLVSVALIVFGLALITETTTAVQLSAQYIFDEDSLYKSLGAIWQYHQRVALSSAILSSLWAPALYYPLKRWWERLNPKGPK
ncbi:MAG: rod shape-determining protein MreD [Phormidesmis priestleyi]|uniref:Rod shape-determining protein MreD n=1 Tax=Phormidesmis priestleyi TaxID=268141 RepID=A0A2W4XS06_9CYAN|nr:MAG: rod shape-determining protein MreD [Phormidesmis priestleyi]